MLLSNSQSIVYNSSLEDYSLEVERIGHELEHVNQANIVYNQNYFEDYEYLRDIIIEGGATSAMKYSKKISSEKTASNYIDYESYSLEYKIDNGEGYARYMSLYNELMYFVGYDTMQKIKLGEEPISVIEEKLEDKYGSDITNSIFKELENLDKAYSHNDDKAKFTSATNLQNYFNRCVEKDIEDLVNSKQAEEYKNRYNNYYKNIIPQMSKDNKNITTQYFKMDNIDTKLQEKIKEVAKEEYYR